MDREPVFSAWCSFNEAQTTKLTHRQPSERLLLSPVLHVHSDIKDGQAHTHRLPSITCSYLTVASGEALAACTGVLPGVLWPAGGRQGQAEAPVEAGPAFAGVRTRCGLGRGGLGRGRGVRGQLEGRGDGPDAAAAAAAQEQEEEKQGGREAPCNLCGTAAGNCRHTAHTHPHPDPLPPVSSPFFFVVVVVVVCLSPLSSELTLLLLLMLAGLSSN